MGVYAKMTAIADAIREKTGDTEALTLDGMAAGVGEVYAAGEKSAYDAFWDAAQENGERTDYHTAFAGKCWNDTTFNPKYNIVPSSAQSMFMRSGIVDLKGILERQGVVLDFSKTTDFLNLFSFSFIENVGVIDTRAASYVNQIAGESYHLENVEKIILKDDASQKWNYQPFGLAYALKEIRFEGVIGQTISFAKSSKLTQESIVSIMDALSGSATGMTLTLSATAVNNAFETTAGAADGSTSQEWADLIATKANWTISLV